MATQSKSSKIFGKVLSIILCITILGTTYAGFFGGFGAAAGALITEDIGAGEVGINKNVVQDGRGADITVDVAAKPVTGTTTSTTTTEFVVDVVLIVDLSNSMQSDGVDLLTATKDAAKSIVDKLYGMNSQNRIAVGLFNKSGYALNKSGSKVEYSSISTSNGLSNYYFSSSEASNLKKIIGNISLDTNTQNGGTNTEGGFLAADKLVKAGDQNRQKIVIFMTDGLPTGRYKDNGTKVNTVATYDGAGSGIPSYAELTECVSALNTLSNEPNTQVATIFYAGGLSQSDSITTYTKGCTSSSCKCNSGTNKHGTINLKSASDASTTEEKYMSGFYKKSTYDCAKHIVYDLWQPYCAAGIYLPEKSTEMLNAFETVINTFSESYKLEAASNAVYDDIIPNYANVVESSINTTMGEAKLLKDQDVKIDGEWTKRDIVRWSIGTIPADKQTLSYSIEVKDDKTYGIMDASVQGVLTYDESKGTATHSPLIVQLDEIILAPKGVNDYYVVAQETELKADGNNAPTIKLNDDTLNSLIDTSGDKNDANTIVNDQIAGLNGTQAALKLSGYSTELLSQPKYGNVVLNGDGTFTYVQNSALYSVEAADLSDDAAGTEEYNDVDFGWQDSFTYVLKTKGNSGMGSYNVSGNPTVDTQAALTSEPITVYIRITPDVSELSANKSSVPESGAVVKSGDTIEYTIAVYNPRTVATDVTVTDYIPAGTTLVEGSVSDKGTSDGKKVTWNIKVDARATKNVTFKVTANTKIEGKNNLANAAQITFETPGKDTPDSASTNTVRHGYLNAVKTSSVPEGTILKVGDEITYTITVTNAGSADVNGAAIVDTIPAGLTFVSGNGLSYDNGSVSAVVDVPANGEPVSVSFVAKVNALSGVYGSATFANTATVNGVPTNEVKNTAKHGVVNVYHKDAADGTDLVTPKTTEGNYGDAYSYAKENIKNYDFVKDTGNTSGAYTDGSIDVIFYYDKTPGYATVYYVDTEGNTLAESKSVAGNQGDALENLYGKVDSIGHYAYERTDAASYTLTREGITITHVYKFVPDTTLPTVKKTSDPASGSLVKIGQDITYTITVTNNKYEAMNNVQVTDNIPKGMSFVASDNGTCSGTTVTWNIPQIGAGATATVSFTARVNSTFTESGNLANTASITYTDTGATEPTTVDTNTTTHAVLAAVKSVASSADFYGVGDMVTYKITVTNYGSAAAYNVAVADEIPEGTTYVSGENSKTIAKIEAGASAVVEFTVKINDINAYSANISNTAYVNDDPTNKVDVTAKKGWVIVNFVDEQGNKLAESITYTGKPGDVHGSTDKIVIPAYTYKATDGTTSGVFTEGTIKITHIYEKTPASAVVKYLEYGSDRVLDEEKTISGFVGDAITDTLYHDITDFDFVKTEQPEVLALTDDQITIIHYFSQADDTPPTLVKSSDKGDKTIVKAGDTINYTIVFTNPRVDDVKDVVVTDFLPAGASYAEGSAACSAEGIEAEVTDSKIVWRMDSVAAASSVTFTFAVTVDGNAEGSGNLSNTAKAEYKSRDYTPEDPVPSNSVTNALLDTLKKVNKTVAYEGDDITYTIEVTNRGSAVVNNLTVQDAIPAGTELKSADDFVFDAQGNGAATIETIEIGATASVSFTVTVKKMGNDAYILDIKNAAVINDEKTNEVETNVRMGTLTVNHIDFDGKVLDTSTERAPAGSSYGPLTSNEYQYRVFDRVDAPTTGVYTTDTTTVNFYYERIPAALTVKYLDAATLKEIKTTDSYDGAFIGETIADEYFVNPELTHYDFVETKSATIDMSNKIYDEQSEVIEHLYKYVYDTATLGAEKTSDPAAGATVKTGDEITYTITITNTRYDAVNNVVITDAVPDGTTLVKANNGGKESEGVITWNISKIAAGEQAVVSFTVKANDSFDYSKNLSNTAGYTFTGADGKEGQGNTNTVNHAVIVSSKTVDKASAAEGEELTYTIKVANYGSAASQAVTVADTIPDGTTLTDAGEFTVSGNSLTYAADSLAAGEVKVLTFKVKVNTMAQGVYNEVIRNTAAVNGDPTATTETTVSMGTVTVNHVDYDGTVRDTETLRAETGTPYGEYTFNDYQYRDTNGVDNKTSGFVTEGETVINFNYKRIPAELVIRYVDEATGKEIKAQSVVSGSFLGDKLPTDLQKADITHYDYSKLVKDTCDKSDIYDEVSECVTHYYTYVYDESSVTAVKSASPAESTGVKAGDEITYTITVTNPRYDAISKVVVTDKIPAGTAYVANSASNGGVEKDGTITWSFDSIAANGEQTLTFKVKVSDIKSGINLSNQANVSYVAANGDKDELGTNVVNHSYITFSKAADKSAAAEGESIAYTITVNNYGAADANDIVVADIVPEGTTLASAGDFTVDETTGALTATIEKLTPGASKSVSFTVTVNALGEGVYKTDIKNTAVVNDRPTEEVTVPVSMGDLIVKHVDYDGTVLDTETLRMPTGTPYGPYDFNEYANRESDQVTGKTSGTFSDGLTEITFTYKRIPVSLTVKYIDDVTLAEIKETVVNSSYFKGDVVPAGAYAQEDIEGYNYNKVEMKTFAAGETAPYSFNEDEVIVHYYTRILETEIPTVTKTSDPVSGSVVKAGDTVTYTIKVANTRKIDDLAAVTITDAIPAGMTLVDGSAYVVGNEENVAELDGNVLKWTIGNIKPQSTAIVTFKAIVGENTSGVNLGNTAYVHYTDVQKNEKMDIPSDTTSLAQLYSYKESSVDKDTRLNDGSTIRYTITVKNVGSAAAQNVVVTDAVPADTRLVLDTLPEGAQLDGSVIKYTFDNIEAGAQASFSFEVVVNMNGAYRVDIANTANVNGDDTNSVTNFAERGSVSTKYVLYDKDDSVKDLPGGAQWEGNVGDALNVPQMDTFEKYRYVKTERNSDSDTFIPGHIEIVYCFERIPTTATIKYIDYNTGLNVAADKVISGLYVGDVLESIYKQDFLHYDYLMNDAPETPEVLNNGELVITHYYTYIYDTTALNQFKASVPAGGSTVACGDEIIYTITVENPRYDAISNVIITDTLPFGTTLVEAAGADVSGDAIKWTIETMQPGEKISVSFKVVVDSKLVNEKNLSNTAYVDFTAADGTTETGLRTNTVDHALIVPEKSSDKAEMSVGDEMTYTIKVHNYGSTFADNVKISDKIPDGVKFVRSDDSYKLKNGTIEFVIPSIAAGEEASVSFTVVASELEDGVTSKEITNTAVVCDNNTNEVKTIVKCGTVVVHHVDTNGRALLADEFMVGRIGDEFTFNPSNEIKGYSYKSTEGEPEGKIVDGEKQITFIYDRTPATVTVSFLAKGTNEVLADSESEVLSVGDQLTDMHFRSIAGYNYVESDVPDSYVVTEDGINIIHYYDFAPETFKVCGAAWEDTTPNSTFDFDDNAVGSVLVTLYDSNGAAFGSVYTDANGKFEFEDVPAGEYTVGFTVPDEYKIASGIDYVPERLNSVADNDGVVAISVVGDTDNVGIELYKSRVLGAFDAAAIVEDYQTYTEQYVNTVETVPVPQPVETEKQNVMYTRVLGDIDSVPTTGDNSYGTTAAVMIAAASLFILILCRKGK